MGVWRAGVWRAGVVREANGGKEPGGLWRGWWGVGQGDWAGAECLVWSGLQEWLTLTRRQFLQDRSFISIFISTKHIAVQSLS